MSKILGLDNGYKFTKTSKRVCIGSTIKKGVDDINNVLEATIGDKDYIVGEDMGQYIADIDKLKTAENREVLKVTTLTAIGLSFPDDCYIDVDLIVGVPAAYHSEQKNDIEHFMKNINDNILINKIGTQQTICINSVSVYPQSAGIIFKHATKLKTQTSIVIDIGGGTWDVSQFDGLKMIDKQTYQDGMIKLEEKIAQYLNATYHTNYNANNIFNLYKRGYFTSEGEKHSMGVVDGIIADHVREVITKIKRTFNIMGTDNLFLIGGGASVLNQFIVEILPHAILQDDAQFSNAECFEIMGKMKLSKK